MRQYASFLVFLAVLLIALGWAVSRRVDAPYSVGFELTNQFGEEVTEADFRGAPLLVLFGFTSCRSTCPTQMQRAAHLTRALAGEMEVTPIFVSVDAARDSVTAVADYVGGFHPRFVGLTGSADALGAAAESFHAKHLALAPDKVGRYDIAHPAGLFVVSERARVVGFLPQHWTLDASQQAIRELLQ